MYDNADKTKEEDIYSECKWDLRGIGRTPIQARIAAGRHLGLCKFPAYNSKHQSFNSTKGKTIFGSAEMKLGISPEDGSEKELGLLTYQMLHHSLCQTPLKPFPQLR